MALADRWLGDEPFLNPAMLAARGVSLSPLLQRVARQDLRGTNRQFDESAQFDASGAWAAFAVSRVTVAVYAWQPVLRVEDVAFIRAEPGSPPGIVAANSTQREARAGLALSVQVGASTRLGVAGEWSRRDDAFHVEEESGDPGAGVRDVSLEGSGVGVAVGARSSVPGPWGRALTLGAAFRTVPSLALEGGQTLDIATGDSALALALERAATWEAGVSAAYGLTHAVRVAAHLGARGAQRFDDVHAYPDPVTGASPWAPGLTAGRAAQWSLGLEYAEPEVPLRFRAGAGQEWQSGVPEPRAGVYALGAGWRLDESTAVDVAAIRRTFTRPGRTTGFDDRVVATVTVLF
jgi:hypothetical protein